MYIGIDIGSRTAKGVLFDGKNIVEGAICDTGVNPKKAGESVFYSLLEKSGTSQNDIRKIVGTGYGRVSLEIADKKVTEISCHARGAHFLCPKVKTVIDIGGQDSKVIHVGDDGGIVDFAMNDKCAAGTGKFFEVAAKALEMDLETFCSMEPEPGVEPCEISNMCVVFAETEIISLLAKEIPASAIASGINKSFARRVAAMARRLGIKEELLFVGGGAKNLSLKKAVSEELGIKFTSYDFDPQLMGALGASVNAALAD